MSGTGNNPFHQFVGQNKQQKGNPTVNLFANQPVTTNVAGNNPPSQGNQPNIFTPPSTTQEVNQVHMSKHIQPPDEEYFKEMSNEYLSSLVKKRQKEDAESEKTVAKQDLTEKPVPEALIENRMAKKGGKYVTQERKITPAPVTAQLPSFGPGMTQFVSTEERKIANEGISNFVKESQKEK